MNSKSEETPKSQTKNFPIGWDETRIENLKLFMKATPEQKIDWLWSMMQVIYGYGFKRS